VSDDKERSDLAGIEDQLGWSDEEAAAFHERARAQIQALTLQLDTLRKYVSEGAKTLLHLAEALEKLTTEEDPPELRLLHDVAHDLASGGKTLRPCCLCLHCVSNDEEAYFCLKRESGTDYDETCDEWDRAEMPSEVKSWAQMKLDLAKIKRTAAETGTPLITTQQTPRSPEMIRRDEVIQSFLEATAPKERECAVCGDTYTGMRMICDKRACEAALQMRAAWSRDQRPLDYRGDNAPRGAIFFNDYTKPDPPKEPEEK
jgi:hypothetical protein